VRLCFSERMPRSIQSIQRLCVAVNLIHSSPFVKSGFGYAGIVYRILRTIREIDRIVEGRRIDEHNASAT
jgi:hypothetical protein